MLLIRSVTHQSGRNLIEKLSTIVSLGKDPKENLGYMLCRLDDGVGITELITEFITFNELY